jgi:hypothetical protein
MNDEARAITEKFKAWGERLRAIKRGIQGLPLDEDAFSGMINTKRLEERARVSTEQQFSQTFFRLLGKYTQCNIFTDIADELDEYSIALDGKNWDAFIAMQSAKGMVNVQPIAVSSQAQPKEEKKEKKEKA